MTDVRPLTWWQRRSLRVRLMLIGVLGLVFGLAVSGVVLSAALEYSMRRSVDAEADRTATEVTRLVERGSLPEVVPLGGTQVVQVVDSQGRVRSASINGDRLVPMLGAGELAALKSGERRDIEGHRIGERGPVRVLVTRALFSNEEFAVIVAKPMADVVSSVVHLRVTLLIAFPLLLAVLAVVAWRVIGATLRPVEALRTGAQRIAESPDQRPPAPGRLPLPASRDEIHRLAVTLNDMLDQLAAARAKQRAFIADAAHELRSPLANMRTQIEVAQRIDDPAAWSEVADDLLVDNRRLTRLVDDLLLLARTDDTAAGGRAPVQPVDLSELARTSAARANSTAVAAVDSAPLWTLGDADGLRRLLDNLVDNATRHARSRVVIEVVPDGAYHLLTVTDDGPGIPPADRDRVFDRFTRLDEARARDAGGAGLGLAIVKEIVRRHHGTVRLADAGPGLRVEVRLPTAEA